MDKRILLVDDHELFADGLKYLLSTYGIEISDVAKNGNEALEKARVLKPDLILMDIYMPKSDGIEALKRIKIEIPDVKIIILTTSEENEDLFQALKFGASGYLLKSMKGEQLVDIIMNIENEDFPISHELAARLLMEFSKSVYIDSTINNRVEFSKEDKLNSRQIEVLEYVANGKTYKHVGEALSITERTVKYHMSRIIELLHLENRAQAIAYAAQMGIVNDN